MSIVTYTTHPIQVGSMTLDQVLETKKTIAELRQLLNSRMRRLNKRHEELNKEPEIEEGSVM